MVPSLSPSLTKPELRAAMRAARAAFVNALPVGRRKELEQGLSQQLQQLVSDAKLVGAYRAVRGEIDPLAALENASDIAFPSFAQGQVSFHYRMGECVENGPHGIPQPVCFNPAVIPDLALVPLLAVDRVGHRLGQGGGHFDRVLPDLRAAGAVIIGVGWGMQRLRFPLPFETWDQRLDGFASPDRLEMFT